MWTWSVVKGLKDDLIVFEKKEGLCVHDKSHNFDSIHIKVKTLLHRLKRSISTMLLLLIAIFLRSCFSQKTYYIIESHGYYNGVKEATKWGLKSPVKFLVAEGEEMSWGGRFKNILWL